MSELAKALLAFQKDPPKLTRDAEVDTGRFSYRYMSLDAAMPLIVAALNKHGLVVTQHLGERDGLRTLSTRIHYAVADDGESIASTLVLPATEDMQELGKAITYARRYSLVALLGLVADEDTDGSAGESETASGQVGGSPAGFPPSIPETTPRMATKGQIAEMRDLLAELEMQENRRDPTWATMARQFGEEQLGLKAGEKPNEPQMDTILEYMRGFLKVPA